MKPIPDDFFFIIRSVTAQVYHMTKHANGMWWCQATFPSPGSGRYWEELQIQHNLKRGSWKVVRKK